jgi:uncharacterized protein YgiB involved in biofilm formation
MAHTKRNRKSSASVTLVLVGTAALAGCGQQDETLRRDVYASRNDCVQDWGDEQKCEAQAAGATSGGSHGTFFLGPSYRPGQFGSSASNRPIGTVDAARPGSHAIATSHISRGGFGSTGASHSSGGS